MRRLTSPQDDKIRVLAQAQLLSLREMLLTQAKRRLVALVLGGQAASQDELAAWLGTSQASVSRIAGLIRQDPSVLEESPTEVIARRAVGEIGDDVMMKTLLGYAFTSGQFDPTGGDGYIRGNWREIETALAKGLLTDAEYEQIAREAPVQAPDEPSGVARATEVLSGAAR